MKYKIPFGELRVSDQAKKHVQDCLDSNWCTLGPKTALFEEQWAKLFNYPYSVAVNSGTSGVIASCIALYDYGAEPGDGVICPALSFIASANGIRAASLNPVFVDINIETLGIDEILIEEAIKNYSGKIVAILAVNLMGRPVRLDKIKEIADKYNLKVIVDNCEAYGSQLNGKFALEYADMEITSHYVAHIVGGTELGTVSCKTKELAESIKSIRSHGREPDSLYFNHIRYGLNLKPTDLNVSILLGEVDRFWEIFARRKEILYQYYNATSEFADKVYFVPESPGSLNAPHGFSVTLKEKFATEQNAQIIKEGFEEADIQYKRNFGSIPHHSAFDYLEKGWTQLFPNAQYVGNWGWHIGCSQFMSDEDVEYVCNSLRNILSKL